MDFLTNYSWGHDQDGISSPLPFGNGKANACQAISPPTSNSNEKLVVRAHSRKNCSLERIDESRARHVFVQIVLSVYIYREL